MSYCFNYGGHIATHNMTEEDVRKAEALLDDAFWDNTVDGEFNGKLDFSGYCKYIDSAVEVFLGFIAPFATSGEITCEGEDGSLWKYVYDWHAKAWDSLYGETLYPEADQKAYLLDEEERGLILGLLVNTEPAGMTADDRRRLKGLKQKFGRVQA